MGSIGITVLVWECNCQKPLVMHSIVVGEVNLHKEELASKPARSPFNRAVIKQLVLSVVARIKDSELCAY